MISENTHPELARSLNYMTTIVNRDHTDKEWKQALTHVLMAFAVEIIHPLIPVTGQLQTEDAELKAIMARIKSKHGGGNG